jgi:deoxyribose-phosphate aldolase
MPGVKDAANWDLASMIDHTLLLPASTVTEVEAWCEQAERFHFLRVCVNPCHVKRAVECLYSSPVEVTTVVGFPLGTSLPEVKLYEAQMAVEQGATELDVKINLTYLKEGNADALHAEVAQIVEETGVPVKAVLETALLTDAEKQLAGEICMDAGAAFLMTSTGWTGGATAEDVRLLAELTRGRIEVKASGGIKTVDWAITLLEAGARRLGTSYGVELMQHLQAEQDQEP